MPAARFASLTPPLPFVHTCVWPSLIYSPPPCPPLINPSLRSQVFKSDSDKTDKLVTFVNNGNREDLDLYVRKRIEHISLFP